MTTVDAQQAGRLKKFAVTASVCVSGLLAAIKFVAALYTGSLAVLSSMVDSMADIVSSAITFAAVRFSSQPASVNHRYGYGKAEALSALVQAAFIAGSGIFVIYEGIDRFISPQPIDDAAAGIAVMAVCLVITAALIAFQKFVVRRTESLAVAADSAHYMVDVVTNLSIAAGLAVVKIFDVYWFDTLVAIFVSVYLLTNAYSLARQAVALLTDRELSNEIRNKLIERVESFSFCHGVHDLRSRDLGGTYMFEFHLELDGGLSLYRAHELTDMVENEVKKMFPGSQVIIHQDPAGLTEDRLDNSLSGRHKLISAS